MIHQEKLTEIQRKYSQAQQVRAGEMQARNNLSQYFLNRVKSSQDNYLDQINKEKKLIEQGKEEIQNMERLEALLLEKIKNT